MQKEIANILKSKLIALPFTNLVAGLAQTLTTDELSADNSVTIKVRRPVSYDVFIKETGGDCTGQEVALIPDSKVKSIIYFEDFGASATESRPGAQGFASSLRLVCWLDRSQLVGNDYTEVSARAQAAIVRALTRGKGNYGPFTRLTVDATRIPPQDAALFNRYTYNETDRQYLRPPFEFFAIDLITRFYLSDRCLEDIAWNVTACAPPPPPPPPVDPPPVVPPPAIVSAVTLDPLNIRVIFSEAMGSVTVEGWLFNDAAPLDVEALDPVTWVFTVEEKEYAETITRSYNRVTGTGTLSAAGKRPLSFTAQPVVNTIPAPPPVVISMETTGADLVRVIFSKPMEGVTVQGWVFSTSGWDFTPESVQEISATTFEFTNPEPFEYGEAILGYYSPGTAVSAAGAPLAMFDTFEVVNNTPEPIPAPTVVSITAVSSNIIRVVFNEEVEGVYPYGWAFNNGTGYTAPTAAEIGETPQEVLFTFVGLEAGQTITANYTKGEPPAFGVLANVSGVLLESFTNIPVLNNAPAIPAPTVVSMATVSNTKIRVVFSEDMEPVTIAGWTFGPAPTAVAKVNNTTYDFTRAEMANGDIITGSYNPAAGITKSVRNKLLGAVTNFAVQNNIPAALTNVNRMGLFTMNSMVKAGGVVTEWTNKDALAIGAFPKLLQLTSAPPDAALDGLLINGHNLTFEGAGNVLRQLPGTFYFLGKMFSDSGIFPPSSFPAGLYLGPNGGSLRANNGGTFQTFSGVVTPYNSFEAWTLVMTGGTTPSVIYKNGALFATLSNVDLGATWELKNLSGPAPYKGNLRGLAFYSGAHTAQQVAANVPLFIQAAQAS